MGAVASPFGLRPVKMIGAIPNIGGSVREYKLPSNVSGAFYTGSLILIAANGVPTPAAATPTAVSFAGTAVEATAGVLGVCVGVRYVDPVLKYSVNAPYLPGGAITAGYSDVWIQICDDPNQLFAIQAATVVGSRTNGARGVIGANAAIAQFSGSATTGQSNTHLLTGTNWATPAATTTLGFRIVDILTPDDAYPELLVKYNVGVHSFTNPLGIA